MATLTDAFLADLDALSDGDDQAPKEENLAKDEKVGLDSFPEVTRATDASLLHLYRFLTSIYSVILLHGMRSYSRSSPAD